MILHPAGFMRAAGSGLITEGLVAYWPLTEDFNDYSGNGWNLTAVGDASIASGSLALDGVGDWANTAAGISSEGLYSYPQTLTCWAYKGPNGGLSNGGDYTGFISTQVDSSRRYGICLYSTVITDSAFGLVVQIGNAATSGGPYFITDQVCSLNTWYHFAVVVEAYNVATFYIDGAEYTGSINSGGTSTTPQISAGVVASVGRYYQLGAGNDYYPFDGNIKDARIYTSALSASQIAAIYNGLG